MSSIVSAVRKKILKRLERPVHVYEQWAFNNLHKLYSVIRPGDILLVEGRSEMSRLIQLFTSSHWSHVAMYVGGELIKPENTDRDYYLQEFGNDAEHMLI